MALSLAVKFAFSASRALRTATAHRVCTRSACLLQRTQSPAGGVPRARPAAGLLVVKTKAHHNKDLPVSWYRDLQPWAFETPQATERIRMRLLRGVLAWHTALASSRQSSLLCVVFDFHIARDRNHKNAISGQDLAIRAAPRVSQIPHRARKGGHEPSPRSYTTKVPLACAR